MLWFVIFKHLLKLFDNDMTLFINNLLQFLHYGAQIGAIILSPVLTSASQIFNICYFYT